MKGFRGKEARLTWPTVMRFRRGHLGQEQHEGTREDGSLCGELGERDPVRALKSDWTQMVTVLPNCFLARSGWAIGGPGWYQSRFVIEVFDRPVSTLSYKTTEFCQQVCNIDLASCCVTTCLSFLSRKMSVIILHRVEVVVKWDNSCKVFIRVSAPKF